MNSMTTCRQYVCLNPADSLTPSASVRLYILYAKDIWDILSGGRRPILKVLEQNKYDAYRLLRTLYKNPANALKQAYIEENFKLN